VATLAGLAYSRRPHGQVWLNPGDPMGRFDLIQKTTWAGLT
jgi:hypothetical protein